MTYRKGAKKVKPKSSHCREKMFFLLFLLHPYETMVLVVKNLPANAGDIKAVGSIPGSGRFPGGNLPALRGKSHGERSLAGYSPQGHKQ